LTTVACDERSIALAVDAVDSAFDAVDSAFDAVDSIGGMSIRSELLMTGAAAGVRDGPSGGNGSIHAAASREFDGAGTDISAGA